MKVTDELLCWIVRKKINKTLLTNSYVKYY